MVAAPLPRLPDEIAPLRVLALDLRWTWSHVGDAVWKHIDADLWGQTHNPWNLLQRVSAARLERLAQDAEFRDKLSAFIEARSLYQDRSGWFAAAHGPAAVRAIAYFSMEFGLGEALPLYAGGLGVLAGDFLKTASDLNLPAIGVGLLYQEGYFRQAIDADGDQHEFYPYNDPATLPVEPVLVDGSEQLSIAVQLPGRTLLLRVWRATVGRVRLYLLDSNDPLNTPADRGLTAKLYGDRSETRLLQEIALGVGGWRIVEAMQPDTEICHINEGHAAFAILERARSLAARAGIDFWQAMWATRVGNLFTTHTPVEAGFDKFSCNLMRKHLPFVAGEAVEGGTRTDELVGLGKARANDPSEPFNMAYLAHRGAALTLAVSRLHGEVSRGIFRPLFPRWPLRETPVGHVTNGVHVPTWDSAAADELWTNACGQERWRDIRADLRERIACVSDEQLWSVRASGRKQLVAFVRDRLARHLSSRGLDADAVRQAASVFDPNVLTLGFARRFAEYKRPNLLLLDRERLARLLLNDDRPAQIVVAGKAHPSDETGKSLVRHWIEIAREPRFRRRVVFLEDYDIGLAQELVQGVDLWINTPRRRWEACGTSGMKVLVNGGLNCSVLDGWWDEAYEPGLGWAVGPPASGDGLSTDAEDASNLYDVLEREVVPEFYRRDRDGVPRDWVARIRRSVSELTPRFSAARMAREYVENAYAPLAKALRARAADDFAVAKALDDWSRRLIEHWGSLHIGRPTVTRAGEAWRFSVVVTLGEVDPQSVRVELFAEQGERGGPEAIALRQERAAPGTTNGFVYVGEVATARPADDYTARVKPYHPNAWLPAELSLIGWQR